MVLFVYIVSYFRWFVKQIEKQKLLFVEIIYRIFNGIKKTLTE